MPNLMFHMDVDTALLFFEIVKDIEEAEKRTLNETERTKILVQMAKDGLINSVIETNRTKEQIVKDSARHGKTLYLKEDGTQELL